MLRKLAQRNTGFVYLARALPATPGAADRQAEHPGIQLIPSSRRIYPQRWLASQVLGAVGTDGNGLSGLEYARDTTLRGANGERRLVKDALGQPISLARRAQRRSPGQRPAPDARRGDPGQGRAVLDGVGQEFSPRRARPRS